VLESSGYAVGVAGSQDICVRLVDVDAITVFQPKSAEPVEPSELLRIGSGVYADRSWPVEVWIPSRFYDQIEVGAVALPRQHTLSLWLFGLPNKRLKISDLLAFGSCVEGRYLDLVTGDVQVSSIPGSGKEHDRVGSISLRNIKVSNQNKLIQLPQGATAAMSFDEAPSGLRFVGDPSNVHVMRARGSQCEPFSYATAAQLNGDSTLHNARAEIGLFLTH
jgi:hypothetical protein